MSILFGIFIVGGTLLVAIVAVASAIGHHKARQVPPLAVTGTSCWSEAMESLIAHASFLEANGDHQAVNILARHASRYSMGHMNYGSIDVHRDKRQFLLELRDELDDSLFYIESELMRSEAKK